MLLLNASEVKKRKAIRLAGITFHSLAEQLSTVPWEPVGTAVLAHWNIAAGEHWNIAAQEHWNILVGEQIDTVDEEHFGIVD